jgi:hypothetical protein
MTKYLLAIAVSAALVVSVKAQDYQVRRAAFGNGYDVYGPGGGLPVQTIRPAPFNNGYNVYGPNGGLPQQEIRPLPFNKGY